MGSDNLHIMQRISYTLPPFNRGDISLGGSHTEDFYINKKIYPKPNITNEIRSVSLQEWKSDLEFSPEIEELEMLDRLEMAYQSKISCVAFYEVVGPP